MSLPVPPKRREGSSPTGYEPPVAERPRGIAAEQPSSKSEEPVAHGLAELFQRRD